MTNLIHEFQDLLLWLVCVFLSPLILLKIVQIERYVLKFLHNNLKQLVMQHRRFHSDLQMPTRNRRQQLASRLRLSQTPMTEASILEEPEYQDYPHSARNNYSQFVQNLSFLSGNDESLLVIEEQPIAHSNRLSSQVSATNLAMCRPNQTILDVQAWERIDCRYERPTPRNSCSWVVDGDTLYIFGGFTFNGRLDDVFAFHFPSLCWRKIATTGESPKARENNGAQLYKGRMYIFGGYDGNAWLNDLYYLQLSNYEWCKLEQRGQQPSERFGFASGLQENRMTIFGGFDGNVQLNDAFTLNLDTCIWKKLDLQGDLPAPRSCPSFATIEYNLYVFGGFDGINRLNDFYKLNMLTGKVSRINQHGSIPCPRYFHSSQICNGKLILFGGYNGKMRLNDLYEFEFQKKQWNQLKVDHSPKGRSSMVFQIYNDTLFTFGGYDGTDVLNDFYRMPFKNALIPKSTFLNELESLINNPELSDVIFIVEGKPIHANRAILAVRSQTFKALLFDGFRESESKSKHQIKLPGVSYLAFLDLLKYMYTDQLDLALDVTRLVNLIMLSDQYMIERLKFLCEEQLTKVISLNNVIDLLLVATKFNSKLLRSQCMKIVEEKISLLKIRPEFQLLLQEPEILMEIIQKLC